MHHTAFQQNKQDWLTQQWVILTGKKLNPLHCSWLLGPFGQVNDTGEDFIYQLAKQEELIVMRNCDNTGLLSSFQLVGFSPEEEARIDSHIIDFYQRTSAYNIHMNVQWKPLFKYLGYFVNVLFSSRLKQLYIPIQNKKQNELITSEIIQLVSPKTKEVSYTFWLRSVANQKKIIFSGMYATCQLPSGKTVVKVIFPLPNGNATVLMTPQIGKEGELILNSAGKKWGESGFYFLLQDSKKNYWARYISTFKDRLIIQKESTGLTAHQQFKLWGLTVFTIIYHITPKNQKEFNSL